MGFDKSIVSIHNFIIVENNSSLLLKILGELSIQMHP